MSNQKFKGEILTEKKVINSIIRFYNESNIQEINEGMNWYNEAKDYCIELANRFDLTVQQTAGIIAAFSPQTGWQENKRFALTFLLNNRIRIKSGVQTIKARKILKSKNESVIFSLLSTNGKAYKTKSFFLNIVNPDLATNVTIDRHAIAVGIQFPTKVEALSDRYGNLTKAQYNFFQSCYVKAANKLGILPHQLQAIVWTTYRRIRDLRSYEGNTAHWKPFSTESF